MNYQLAYDQLIYKRKYSAPIGYTESHHILPKSMGGDNSSNNMVRLTAREHYVAHHLLWRIHRTRGMAFAWNMMSIETHSRNAHQYSTNKELRSKAMSEMQMGARNHFYGKQHSDAVKEYIRSINLDKVMPQWVKDKISAAHKGVPKGPMSQATKDKLSAAHTGKVLSEAHKKALGISRTGNRHTEASKLKMSVSKLGIPRSEATKKKLSEAHKGKVLSTTHKANISKTSPSKKRVKCVETGIVYGSVVEASIAIGRGARAKSGISQVCLGHRKSAAGYTWMYV